MKGRLICVVVAVVCGAAALVGVGRPVAAAPGDITTVAGGPGEGPATTVAQRPHSLATFGPYVYIGDYEHNVVRVVDTRTGAERVFAGNGHRALPERAVTSGDGGPAVNAQFVSVYNVATDGAGNVYIVDTLAGVVRKVDPSTGIITTVAGRPAMFPGCCPPVGGDGGPARDADLALPTGLAIDAAGNLYIADSGHHRVRKVTPSGTITTFLGDGDEFGPFGLPGSLTFDGAGNLYVVSRGDAIRKVSPVGVVTTVAEIDADIVASDPAGNLSVVSSWWVTRIDAVTGAVTSLPTPPVDRVSAVGLALGPGGTVYVSDTDSYKVWRWNGVTWTAVAGNGYVRFSGDEGPATKAVMDGPQAVAVDSAGTQYIADTANDRVRKVTPGGTISTLTEIEGPVGITLDALGRPYVFADYNEIFRLDPVTGAATSVAGGGERYAEGADGHPATEADLAWRPSSFSVGMAFDRAGNLYFADSEVNRVRKIDTAGIISTVVWGGTNENRCGGVNPYDPIPEWSCPTGVAVDAAGNIYVAEWATERLRRINTTGTITDLSGVIPPSFKPSAVAVDGAGNLFAADPFASVITMVTPNGENRHVAGGSFSGFFGDGGPADQAKLWLPSGLAISGSDLYFADTGNYRVRKIAGAAQPSTTLTVRAWGWNGVGQLGDGSRGDRPVQTQVPDLGLVTSIAAGYHHTLAVKNGEVWAWGWNAHGQLGNGTTADSAVPVKVHGLPAIMVSVAAGAYHSMAVDSFGRVWTWGWNGVGQLCSGTTVGRHVPAVVPNLPPVSRLSAGLLHSVVSTWDRRVYSWGWNAVGQLGDGTTTDRWSPVQVPGLTDVGYVTAGAHHTFAIKGYGDLYGWGWNAVGQLGDGTITDRHLPIKVPVPGYVGDVAAGLFHTVAVSLDIDTTVWAWGWNGVGQLGDGTTTDRRAAVPVAGLQGVTDVSAGAYHSLALRNDGTARAWGWNGYGQVGDGTTTQRNVPVEIPGLRGAARIEGGAFHSMAH